MGSNARGLGSHGGGDGGTLWEMGMEMEMEMDSWQASNGEP